MSLYDLIFLGILAFSVFMGLTRGAVKEIVTLLALVVSGLLALWLKPWLIKTFNLEIIGGFVAAAGLFVLSYLAIRYFGQALSESLHKATATNIIDRVLGFAFGLARTILIIGIFHFIFSAVMTKERMPAWFTNAKVYPLGAWSAGMIQKFVPQGTAVANKVAPNAQIPVKDTAK